MDIRKQLFEMQDNEYKAFHSSLIPNVNPERIIGVRVPQLRKLARDLNAEDSALFIKDLPHFYYEENNLHAFLIERITDYSECIEAVNDFLPYVDNWATCDSLRPKVFKKHSAELITEIKKWINSCDAFTVRFGLEMLMCHYLDNKFDPAYLDLAAAVKSDEYYVRMMQAWFFATALVKQHDCALRYIEGCYLDEWVHNKTIQKSVESYRLSEEQKEHLKKFRI